jgi:hypothetical protein
MSLPNINIFLKKYYRKVKILKIFNADFNLAFLYNSQSDILIYTKKVLNNNVSYL